MMDTVIAVRNYIVSRIYKWVIKPIFFRFDPEKIHDSVSKMLEFIGFLGIGRAFTRLFLGYSNPLLEQEILGITFKNPVGLAAGFDKNASLIPAMKSLGFGFTEVGSITKNPYAGNQKPRLYRLPESQALRVNYGLKNVGAEALSQKIKNIRRTLPVGISIAKTNSPETSEVKTGIEDYFFTYQAFKNIGDYFTINISCPNTCEASPVFAEPKNLDLLLQKIFSEPKQKPVFVKLSPDLVDERLYALLETCKKYPVDGFICANLTKKNIFGHDGRGGFSGKAVEKLSNETIRKVYKFFNGEKIIIGVGGIFSAEDAYKKIKAGASLIQLITGMIYEGPQVISDINLGLAKLLQKDGYKNISEAVGKE